MLNPLVEAMTRKDPVSRPLGRDALTIFDQVEKKQPIHVIKWKLKKKTSNPIMHLYRDMISLRPVASAYAEWITGMWYPLRTFFVLERQYRLPDKIITRGVCPVPYLKPISGGLRRIFYSIS